MRKSDRRFGFVVQFVDRFCGVVWFLRKIRPTQLWVELGCGNNNPKQNRKLRQIFLPFRHAVDPILILRYHVVTLPTTASNKTDTVDSGHPPKLKPDFLQRMEWNLCA